MRTTGTLTVPTLVLLPNNCGGHNSTHNTENVVSSIGGEWVHITKTRGDIVIEDWKSAEVLWSR